MENTNLTLYSKNKIIEMVSDLLKYYGESKYKKEVIKAAHLLMDKIRYCDDENITLESDFIEEILFALNEDGTKSIVNDVYYKLRSIDADLLDVSFDNVHIAGFYFNGLKNVEIDIQKIPNSNLSKAKLDGVKLKGTLDGANIEETNFTGYVGDLILNPQLIQNKSLRFTDINGLIVNGSFDGVNVHCMKTKGFKGEITINPQKVKDKDIWGVDFDGIHLVGDYDQKNGIYNEPCFENCRLYNTSFKGCIGNVVIPLDKLYSDAVLCNFTGVKLTGKVEDDESLGLMFSYYEDENGKKIYFKDNKDNSEEPEKDGIVEEDSGIKENHTHKTRIRKTTFINRILGNYK